MCGLYMWGGDHLQSKERRAKLHCALLPILEAGARRGGPNLGARMAAAGSNHEMPMHAYMHVVLACVCVC